jgi:tetratricopeptide (TPR) repeat protein
MAVALLVLVAGAAPARADQKDPKLPHLFDRLMDAELEQTEAREIEGQIWTLWQPSGSETTDLLLQRVEMLLEQDAYDPAINLLNEVVGLSPEYAEGWNKRATAHFMRNDYKAALQDVERTLRLEPRHFGAWSGLGTILLAMGEDARALHAYQKALLINPHLTNIAKEVQRLEVEVKGRGI